MGITLNTRKATHPQGSGQANLDAGLSLLFGGIPTPVQNAVTIQQLPIALLDAHPKQGRWSMAEDELNWLAANIAQVGVLDAIQVMQKPDGRYLLLEGHRRTEASRRAGLTTIPAVVLPYNEKQADIIFNASNLGQRHTLRASEKAWAYLDLEQDVADGQKTTAAIASLTGDNARAIQRYKRLTMLAPPLLAGVDSGGIPLFAGVSLSYLSQEEQQTLMTVMDGKPLKKLTLKQADALKDASARETLTAAVIAELLFPGSAPSPRKDRLAFSRQDLSELIPTEYSDGQAKDLIRQALRLYWAQEKSRCDDSSHLAQTP